DFCLDYNTVVQTRWLVPATLAQFRRALAVAVRSVNLLPDNVRLDSGIEAWNVEETAAGFATILGYVDNVEWEGLSDVVDAWRGIQDMTSKWAESVTEMRLPAWWNA